MPATNKTRLTTNTPALHLLWPSPNSGPLCWALLDFSWRCVCFLPWSLLLSPVLAMASPLPLTFWRQNSLRGHSEVSTLTQCTVRCEVWGGMLCWVCPAVCQVQTEIRWCRCRHRDGQPPDRADRGKYGLISHTSPLSSLLSHSNRLGLSLEILKLIFGYLWRRPCEGQWLGAW